MTLPRQTDKQAHPISILQITDLHFMSVLGAPLNGINTSESFQQVLDSALSQHPQVKVVLLTGDLAEQASSSSYQHLANILANYDITFRCIPGNHDDFSVMQTVLNQPNYNCEKQLLLSDNWQVLMLNSQMPDANGGELAAIEIEFLKINLEQHPQRHTLVATHHPCVNTHSIWMDTMRITNSQEFIDLLKQHPQVKVVLTGHIHQELEQQFSSLQLLGTPSTCFQFKPLSDTYAVDENKPAYRWLDLYPDGHFQSGVNYLP